MWSFIEFVSIITCPHPICKPAWNPAGSAQAGEDRARTKTMARAKRGLHFSAVNQ